MHTMLHHAKVGGEPQNNYMNNLLQKDRKKCRLKLNKSFLPLSEVFLSCAIISYYQQLNIGENI
jgi:hypothetical protein